MSPSRVSLLALSALAAAAAGRVSAQPVGASVILAAADFASPNYGPGPVDTRRTLEWDSKKGRWGLRLGVEQRSDHLSEWQDIQPGVYYKITPRLHIGGAVSLSPAPQINQHLVEPQDSTPRVRLETTFKF